MAVEVLTVTVRRVGTLYVREPWRGVPSLGGWCVLSPDEVSGVAFSLQCCKGPATRHVVRIG